MMNNRKGKYMGKSKLNVTILKIIMPSRCKVFMQLKSWENNIQDRRRRAVTELGHSKILAFSWRKYGADF